MAANQEEMRSTYKNLVAVRKEFDDEFQAIIGGKPKDLAYIYELAAKMNAAMAEFMKASEPFVGWKQI